MKKGDVCLLVLVLVIAVSFVFMSGEGGNAAIYVNGELYKRLPLDEDTELTVKSKYGENTIVVQDGRVSVKNSDCDNHLCEKETAFQAGRSIVCLPNRLSIVIEKGTKGKQPDVVI